MRTGLLCVLAASCSWMPAVSAPASTPLQAVPAAGAGRTTLVIYDAPAKPFSLVNELSPLMLMLSRFDTKVVTRQAAEATEADIRNAEYIVVAGMCGVPRLNPAAAAALAKTDKPLLAIGWATALAGAPPVQRNPLALPNAVVPYRNIKWKLPIDPYFPGPAKPGVALATPDGGSRPLIWRSGERFGFGALPGAAPLARMLSDFLLDFYGVGKPPAGGLFFAIQNFHPGSDAGAFRRMVDYLYARGNRFVVSTQIEGVPGGENLMPRETFLDALKYAQAHGGQVILRGAVASSATPAAFSGAGLAPIGWELPDGGGNEPPASVVQDRSGCLLGNLLADPDETGSPFPADTILFSREGRTVLPLNVNPPTGASDNLRMVAENVTQIAALRDGVAGVAVPAWLPFQQMRDIVDAARSAGMENLSIERMTTK